MHRRHTMPAMSAWLRLYRSMSVWCALKVKRGWVNGVKCGGSALAKKRISRSFCSLVYLSLVFAKDALAASTTREPPVLFINVALIFIAPPVLCPHNSFHTSITSPHSRLKRINNHLRIASDVTPAIYVKIVATHYSAHFMHDHIKQIGRASCRERC